MQSWPGQHLYPEEAQNTNVYLKANKCTVFDNLKAKQLQLKLAHLQPGQKKWIPLWEMKL